MKTRLAELRREKGLTLKELGKILHVKDNALSQYETGKRNPKIGLLIEIANFFNVSLDYLTYDTDKRDYPIESKEDAINLLKRIDSNELHYDAIAQNTALKLSMWILVNLDSFRTGKYSKLHSTAHSFLETFSSENKVLKQFSEKRITDNNALDQIENKILFGDTKNDEYYGADPLMILEFMNESERIGLTKTEEILKEMKKAPSEYPDNLDN